MLREQLYHARNLEVEASNLEQRAAQLRTQAAEIRMSAFNREFKVEREPEAVR